MRARVYVAIIEITRQMIEIPNRSQLLVRLRLAACPATGNNIPSNAARIMAFNIPITPFYDARSFLHRDKAQATPLPTLRLYRSCRYPPDCVRVFKPVRGYKQRTGQSIQEQKPINSPSFICLSSGVIPDMVFFRNANALLRGSSAYRNTTSCHIP